MPELPYNAARIPLSRLGDLGGWHLSVRCGACGRRVMRAVSDLADKHGARLPVWRLVARLRCESGGSRSGARCGGKPDLVTLVQGRERRKDFQVIREIVVPDDRLRINE